MKTKALLTIIICSAILSACPHFGEGIEDAEFETTLYSIKELDGSHNGNGYVGYSYGDIELEQSPWSDLRGYISFDLQYLKNRSSTTKVHSCKLWMSSNGYSYGLDYISFAVGHVSFDNLDSWENNIHKLNNPSNPDPDQWDKTFAYASTSLESGRWITVDVKDWCNDDIRKGRTYSQFEIRLDNESIEDVVTVRFQEGISEGNPKMDTYRAPYLDISYD